MLLGGTPIQYEAGTLFVDPGVVGTDSQDGDITDHVKSSGSVNTIKEGSYSLTYSVKNSAGRSASTIRIVNVVDSIDACQDEPCVHGTCRDHIGGYSCSCSVEFYGENCDTERPGEMLLGVVSLLDVDGLDVSDYSSTAATIVLQGVAALQHEAGTPYVEPGVSATDLIDGDLTSSIVVSGTVATGVLGSTVLTYAVTNTAGKTASVTRVVHVVDTIDGCASSPCAHGTCQDSVAGFSCECNVKWMGTTCNTPRPCTCGKCVCFAYVV